MIVMLATSPEKKIFVELKLQPWKALLELFLPDSFLISPAQSKLLSQSQTDLCLENVAP